MSNINEAKEEKRKKPGFWMTVASFIVDKRKAIILLFVFAAIYSAICMNRVKINQDITSYLPATSETRVGLTTMEDQFITYGSARVMVCNITFAEAKALAEELENIEGVKQVAFENSKSYFRGSNALFEVTVNGTDDERISIDALNRVEELLAGYDVYVSSAVGATEKSMASLGKDMNLILVLAVLIIVLVLFISTRAFMEIPVLLITFGAAALLNKGSNFWLGEISSVTDSIAVVLQLALAIDYAIILCDRYMEEHETLPPVDAVKVALSKAIPEISSSSLTTVSGMAAMMFMQFKLGFDMGIVLVKAILFSLISVFFLMPGIILIFSKGIDKTMHKSFVPKISFVGKFASLTKYFIPPVFVVVIAFAFYASSNCTYLYDVNSVPSATKSEATIAKEKINDSFGSVNQLVVMVPVGDYEKEAELLAALEELDCVESAMGLANQAVNDDYMVTSKLTPRQFSELADIDIEVVRVLYMAYAYSIEQYGPVVTGIDDYSVPIIDMFLFLYDQYQEGYVKLSTELDETLTELYDKLHDGELQLKGTEYSRIVLNFDMPVEGEPTYEQMEVIRETAEKYYGAGSVILVGNSTSAHDLASSFATDNIIISVLTALFVLIILLFTFQSAGLPVLLVLTIQGSIWINFTVPAIEGQGIYFIAYLIVSAIQMGATIDYAIVISSRYLALKPHMDIKEAITETLNQAFPTIFTSGTILTCAGFLIGRICSDATVAAIGVALGRGTLISIILVLFVLPQILLLGDVIIEKTALSVKLGGEQVNLLGKMAVNGYIRGEFTGRIDGEVKGILEGKMDGVIDTKASGRYMEAKEMEPAELIKSISKEIMAEQAADAAYIEANSEKKTDEEPKKPVKAKRKKFFGLFTILIMLSMLSVFNSQAYADEIDKNETVVESADEELELSTIYINSAEDFLKFAYECRFDAYSLGTIFILTEDIDLTETDFEGVPYFNGTFEGNNHIVKLDIHPDGSNYGLFRYVGSFGLVRNLSVKGKVNAKGSAENIGGIAGVNYGILSGCSYVGTVNGIENVGGIVGYNSSEATVISCTNTGVILAEDNTGGIAGKNDGSIVNCTNRGDVNVEELEPTLDIGGVDLGNLNLTENISNRDNIGGIAGFSKGLISKCTNNGTVGFLHAGYNVGGIAGMQSGVITDCTNKGSVLGRKDVGGIVGQAAPYVESEFLDDAVDNTQNQIDELNRTLRGINSTVSSTANKTEKYATKITKTTQKQLSTLSKDLSKLTATVAKEYPECQEYCDNINQAVENINAANKGGTLSSAQISVIQENLAVISKNMTAMSKVFEGTGSTSEEMLNKVSDELAKTSQYKDTQSMIKTIDKGINSVTKSVDRALDQIEGIRSTITDSFSVVFKGDEFIEDISSVDNAVNLDGVVAKCTNYGYIRGDINIGGIAGCMNVEYSNDPEFDLSFTKNLSLVLRSTVNGVTIGCENNGRVEVKKNNAGGIAGLQSLGLIYDCGGYGNVFGDAAKYLGGVAGEAEATISGSYALCTITGAAYLGGIAGEAYGIDNCIVIPAIEGEGECLGSVAGKLSDISGVSNNFYYNDEVCGVDGINYIGGADYLTYDEIMKLKGRPEHFKRVIVSFQIEGEEVSSFFKNYGAAIRPEDYPVVTEHEGYYTEWTSDSDTEYLTGNIIMDVEYIPWTTAIAGSEKLGKRDVFMAVGEFYEGTVLEMTAREGIYTSDELKQTVYSYDWDILSPATKEFDVVEGHFLIPEGFDSAELWLYDGNGWRITDTETDGRCLVADLKVGTPFSVIGVHKAELPKWIYAAIAGALFAILIVGVLTGRLIKRVGRKKSDKLNTGSEEKKEETEAQI